MRTRLAHDAVYGFALSLDRHVARITGGAVRLLKDPAQGPTPAELAQVRRLLADLRLSADPAAQALLASEIKRCRGLDHEDSTGRIGAISCLHAIDGYLSGDPTEAGPSGRVARRASKSRKPS
jgi:hypothetical protein